MYLVTYVTELKTLANLNNLINDKNYCVLLKQKKTINKQTDKWVEKY